MEHLMLHSVRADKEWKARRSHDWIWIRLLEIQIRISPGAPRHWISHVALIFLASY